MSSPCLPVSATLGEWAAPGIGDLGPGHSQQQQPPLGSWQLEVLLQHTFSSWGNKSLPPRREIGTYPLFPSQNFCSLFVASGLCTCFFCWKCPLPTAFSLWSDTFSFLLWAMSAADSSGSPRHTSRQSQVLFHVLGQCTWLTCAAWWAWTRHCRWVRQSPCPRPALGLQSRCSPPLCPSST